MDSDILIVGAGPVGLTLAVDLHRRGIIPRIVDKVTSGTNYSRAMVVHTRQQEQLSIAGVMDRMLRFGHPMRPTRVHTMGRYVGTLDLAGMDSPFPAPWMIYQSQIEAELEAHLAEQGVKVERSVEFLSLEQDATSVRVRLREPDGQETYSTHQWLIGCDGARSPVREATDIPYSGRRYGEDVFQLGDVTLEGLPPETGGMWLGPKGTLVIIVPMHGHHRVIISYAVDAIPSTGAAGSTYGYDNEQLTIEELEDLTCRFGPKVKLSEPRWLARYGVEGRVAERYREGRVLLAGDAAHIHLPLAGQWMNVGIGDAFNLGWKLALVCNGNADERLLDSYTAERRAVAFGISMANEKLWGRVSTPPLWYKIGSPILGPFLFPRAKTQKRLRSNISQLAVAYPQSPIVVNRTAWDGGVRAGDRAPDAPILGSGSSVHGMLREDVRGLLLFAAGRDDIAIARAIEVAEALEKEFGDNVRTVVLSTAARSLAPPGETEGDAGLVNLAVGSELYSKYGADENAAFHIRPDSHVGYAGPIALDELRTYLSLTLKPQLLAS